MRERDGCKQIQQIITVYDKHHEGSTQGTVMADNTVEEPSLYMVVTGGLAQELAFKSRPEGQDSSHKKSQEKNILRRGKEQGSGKNFPFSRHSQLSAGKVEFGKQSREYRTRDERARLGPDHAGIISPGKKFSFYFRYNRKSAENSKQRRDTLYLHFLEDGPGCSL